MQGAEKFVTVMVVRITNFSATPQVGYFSFKHKKNRGMGQDTPYPPVSRKRNSTQVVIA